MNITKQVSIVLVFAILAAVTAYANGPSKSDRGERRGPPPEAYSACEDKSEGEAAEFVSPRGDTITGTCEDVDGELVLRPDNPPQGQ